MKFRDLYPDNAYIFTFREDGRSVPAAVVTPLGNGMAIYEDCIALVEKQMPIEEAFSKARHKKSLLTQRH